MKRISKDFTPKTKEKLLFRELDNGGAIYTPEEEKIHTLNATAAYIWCLCNGNYTIDEIINHVRDDFSISDDVDISDEVFSIIKEFQKLNLLEKT